MLCEVFRCKVKKSLRLKVDSVAFESEAGRVSSEATFESDIAVGALRFQSIVFTVR